MIEHRFKPNTFFRFTELPTPGTANINRPGFETVAPVSVGLTFLPEGTTSWSAAITVYPRWLPWHSGLITETPLVGQDVFSGPFSGCWMTVYQDRQQNMPFVGHIGTSDIPDHTKAVKRAWQRYATTHEDDLITGFNAARDYTGALVMPSPKERPDFYGLVTPSLKCYVILAYLQFGVEPRTYRTIAIQECLGRQKAIKDIFRNDREVHDIGLSFNMNDWKASTSGGALHTRSAQLKSLDTALEAYFRNPCLPALQPVRTAFNKWKTEKPAEYSNPTRNRRNCVQELEQYLANNV